MPPSEKQARIIWLALTGAAIALLVFLAAALVWGLGQVLQILSPVLWPLAVAGVIAYLLDPVVDWFERKGLKRATAIICVFGIALLVIAGVFGSVVPQIVSETRQFVSGIPRISRTLEARIEHWVNHPPPWVQRFLPDKTNAVVSEPSTEMTNSVPTITDTNASTAAPSSNAGSGLGGALNKETLQSATGWVAGVLPDVGRWLFGQVTRVASWFGILVAIGLVPVYAFYLLLEKRRIESKWTNYLPVADSHFKDELVFVLRSINSYLIAFFRGQVLVAICDGILYMIGFLSIGLPYAVLLGAAAIVLTIIPFLGAIIVFVSALIISLVSFGDWLHPLLVVGVFAVVQTLEGLVISPKVMGGRVGLHPLTIIVAVMVGTTLLGGLLGGILAIPLTAVLRVLLSRYVWQRRNESPAKAG